MQLTNNADNTSVCVGGCVGVCVGMCVRVCVGVCVCIYVYVCSISMYINSGE